jgi:hypothetical protein
MTGLVLLAALLAPQDEKPSIFEVVEKHRERLFAVEGVVDVTAGGTPSAPVLVVKARSAAVVPAVRRAIGAELGGVKVFVYAAPEPPAAEPAPPPPPPSEPGRTEAKADERKPEPAGDPMERCDIIRDQRKLKELTHHENGKTYTNCQLMRRQVIAGGGGHAFWYTKHRSACPIRRGEVPLQAAKDSFDRWVLTQGFCPAARGSFLWPTELKGSDSLWFRQVRDDLTSVLPYIRDGATWTDQPTPEGFGWSWKAPKVPPPADPTPTK